MIYSLHIRNDAENKPQMYTVHQVSHHIIHRANHHKTQVDVLNLNPCGLGSVSGS